jgi:AraC-like DNA-binding protein
MAYGELQPSAVLRSWVVCYWWRTEEPGPVGVRVLPDGCADVIFDLSTGGSMAVGTMTRPLVIEAATPEYFGVRFRPGRAALFFCSSMSVITDARVPLAHLMKGWSSVAERLAEADSLRARAAILDAALEQGLASAQPERRVDSAVASILRSRGRASIDDVAAAANLSRQHLGRLFAHHVGVSPKTFARVTRFRALLELGDAASSWADVAAQLGYADQSHLIADFREYAGSTPVPFFLSRRAQGS